ncbi:MAG: M20 family metallo-hydrolase [Bacillota bacterium]
MKGFSVEEERLDALSKVTSEGPGVTRLPYTPEDARAKRMVRRWMDEDGLESYEDAIGNLFGRANGERPGTILTGSHLDTVRNGGAYDGALGVVSAISAVSALVGTSCDARRNVEACATVGEEGSRFSCGYLGSLALTGNVDLNTTDHSGMTLAQALRQAGMDPALVHTARRSDIAAFVELHIEQGPVLEASGLAIGLVNRVTGLWGASVRFTGRADHAGTTPMDARLDALVAASSLISRLPALAVALSRQARATVGMINVTPGSSNVVPSECQFSLDVRALYDADLIRLSETIEAEVRRISQETGCAGTVKWLYKEPPVGMDYRMLELAAEVADRMQLPYRVMESGAGHDAQIISRLAPSLIVFIPCVGGRSHCPDEAVKPEHIRKGTVFLTEFVRRISFDAHLC